MSKYSECPNCHRKGYYEKGLIHVCRNCGHKENREMTLEWRRQPNGDYKANLGQLEFLITAEGVLFSSYGEAQQFTEIDAAKAAAERIALAGDEEE